METISKQCKGKGCPNQLPADSQFELCELCRVSMLRNAHAILLDPFSPITDRADFIFQRSVSLLSPEEALNAIRKIEWLYLEYQRVAHSFKIQEHRQKSFDAAVSSINAERAKPKTPKLVAKKEKRATKLKNMLGDRAKEIMGGEFDDL